MVQRLRKRWYAYIPPALAGSGIALPPMVLLAAALLPFAEARTTALLDWLMPILAIVTLASMPFFILWLTWAVPWFDSANPALTIRHTPKQWWRDARHAIWMPALLAIGYCLVLVVVRPFVRGLASGLWQWGAVEHQALLAGLVLAAVLVPWTSWIGRRVERRFRRMVAQRQLCFECGYDLHGNPEAASCPECGEAVYQGLASRPVFGRRWQRRAHDAESS